MPANLPASMTPSSVSWTRNRPRRTVQSDFTGFTQQISTGTAFLHGELNLRPQVSAQDFREWQRFFAEVENDDGTFWVPIWTEDYDDNDVTGQTWWNGTVSSVDDRRVFLPTANATGMDQQIGRNVQVRLRSNNNISFVFTLTGTSSSGSNTFLTFGEKMPFSIGDLVSINTGLKVAARAILPDPASQTVVMDALAGSQPSLIPWQEATGALLQQLSAA